MNPGQLKGFHVEEPTAVKDPEVNYHKMVTNRSNSRSSQKTPMAQASKMNGPKTEIKSLTIMNPSFNQN